MALSVSLQSCSSPCTDGAASWCDASVGAVEGTEPLSEGMVEIVLLLLLEKTESESSRPSDE